ncbi:MAG TPA: FGGY family carbohydrate kinase [Anaerolineaceae bacterium]
MPILAGLDVGTTTIKAILLDSRSGQVIDLRSVPTPTHSPTPGCSEHDPEELFQAACTCLCGLKQITEARTIAISSFAEAGVPVDSSFQPLSPAIAWFDRRSEPQAGWIEQQINEAELHAITGQRVSPSFGITKWLWFKQHKPAEASRLFCWLPVPDYLLYRLTNSPPVTSYSIASRTLLFDQTSLNWSPVLLSLAGLEPHQLPQPLPSGTIAGYLTREAHEKTRLPVGIPCILGGHDHLCAALAAGAVKPGIVVESTGTAEALLFVLKHFITSAELAQSGFACYAHTAPGTYVLKGGLKAYGGAIDWLARLLAGDLSPQIYSCLEMEAQAGIGRIAGPVFLPHLIGSGTPEGDRYSMAALAGLQPDHTRGDIYRGLLESLACWLRHNLEEMTAVTGQTTSQVIILGGTTRIGLFNQLKADLLGIQIRVPSLAAASAVGAALLAGTGAGVYSSLEQAAVSLNGPFQVYSPDSSRSVWYDQLYNQVYRPLYPALASVHHKLAEINQK